MEQLEDNCLEDKDVAARISVYRQFYQLAKDSHDNNFRKSVFDVLCAHLRNMTSAISYKEGAGKDYPTDECQSLLNIIFDAEDFIFIGFPANLEKVHLASADIPRADFTNANFSGANLSNTDIADMCFENANFSGANLLNVNFIGAYLRWANFSGANLSNADLQNANLDGANLSHANLSQANLDGACMSSVNLSHANLQDAAFGDSGLEDVIDVNKTDFRGATISLEYGWRKITPKDIPDSGQYIAEWTDEKFWAKYE